QPSSVFGQERTALILLDEGLQFATQDVGVRLLFERQFTPQGHAIVISLEALGETPIHACRAPREIAATFQDFGDVHRNPPLLRLSLTTSQQQIDSLFDSLQAPTLGVLRWSDQKQQGPE